MPNTFLDSYFKGAELRQREKLQQQEIAAQQAQQMRQFGLQQQQLQVQQAQFGQQMDWQKTQAAAEQARMEAARVEAAKQQKFQNQFSVLSGLGQGSIQPVQRSFVPGAIGVQKPLGAGEMEIEGMGAFRPTTPFERGVNALELKSLTEQQEAQEKLRELMRIMELGEAQGFKMDPKAKGMLTVANLMPNSNAVGLLNDAPSSFGEAGAKALDLEGKRLVELITKNPAASRDPAVVRQLKNFGDLRELFMGPPSVAAAAPLARDADSERRASRTYQAAAEAFKNAGLDPQSKNFGQQLEAVKFAITTKLGAGDFSLDAFTKAVDDFTGANRRLDLMQGATATPAVPVK